MVVCIGLLTVWQTAYKALIPQTVLWAKTLTQKAEELKISFCLRENECVRCSVIFANLIAKSQPRIPGACPVSSSSATCCPPAQWKHHSLEGSAQPSTDFKGQFGFLSWVDP